MCSTASRFIRWVFFISLSGIFSPLSAGNIALIIDDIGYNRHYGKAAASLHQNIALSVLPEAPFATELANTARLNGNEVMLHIPMQASEHAHSTSSTTLSTSMGEPHLKSILRSYLDRFPAITGINNHMGSLLTRNEKHMSWVMEVLSEYPGLFFVDSRTHHETVAAKIASDYFILNTTRDVFLDSTPDDDTQFRLQFKRLLKKADENGFALAIAHPYPETIRNLKKLIPKLEEQGHQLIPVSQFIDLQDTESCPQCSSHWLKVVKNSKP